MVTRLESFVGYCSSAIVIGGVLGAFWAWLEYAPRLLAWAMGWEWRP